MEVLGSEGKKVICEVVDDHVIEEATDHDDIELRGYDFDLFDKYEKGVDREVLGEFTYLLMLIFFFSFFWSGLQCPKAYSLWGGVVPSPSIG